MEGLYLDGSLQLITRDCIIQHYKNSCVRYVNERISNAVKNRELSVDLSKRCLYKELIEQIEKEYNILSETDESIIISWKE